MIDCHRAIQQVDASAIRLLDLAALSCVVDVVEAAHSQGIAVVFAGCSRKVKASLKACGLYRRVGGPLTMHSTEEVYTLLVEAPSFVPQLASQCTSAAPPPRFYSRHGRTGGGGGGGGTSCRGNSALDKSAGESGFPSRSTSQASMKGE